MSEQDERKQSTQATGGSVGDSRLLMLKSLDSFARALLRAHPTLGAVAIIAEPEGGCAEDDDDRDSNDGGTQFVVVGKDVSRLQLIRAMSNSLAEVAAELVKERLAEHVKLRARLAAQTGKLP